MSYSNFFFLLLPYTSGAPIYGSEGYSRPLHIITLYTPRILHPICGISRGFPKISSTFPPTFEQIFIFKVVHRAIHLPKGNDFFCIWKSISWAFIYWTPMSSSYFLYSTILEKCGQFWKNCHFSRADMAGLGEIPHRRIWPDWVYRNKCTPQKGCMDQGCNK